VSGDPANSGTWTYLYDAANRMTSATGPGSIGTTTYGYDGAGNRTSVQVGSNPAVTTAYDGAGLPVSSSDGTTYTHAETPGLHVRRIPKEPRHSGFGVRDGLLHHSIRRRHDGDG
jgi:hypothetical protein